MENNSVLIAGGAGYLGCVLVEELLERGYAVSVFDRLFFGDSGLAKFRDRLRVVAGDIRCPPDAIFEDAGAVIHLGGLSNDPTAEYNPQANYQMNAVATQTLGEMARRHGIRRFLYASSCSIYDVGVTDEEQDVMLTEDSAVRPRAVYATSKLAGERALLELADRDFCPVILRMGTLFGFSPRMRYDLVVNTFVKDALTKGYLTLNFGGQMWRPLVNVRDAAHAYVVALEADEALVAGQVFNVVSQNFRISELGLRVREALREINISTDIRSNSEYSGIRNYRVSSRKIQSLLNFQPAVTVAQSVHRMVDKIREYGFTDFDNDRYYNIRWMRLLEEIKKTIDITGTIFDPPERSGSIEMLKHHVEAHA